VHSLSGRFQVTPLHRTPRFFKRHVYGKRHGSLNQTGTSFAAASLKIGAKALRSPEDFIRKFVKRSWLQERNHLLSFPKFRLEDGLEHFGAVIGTFLAIF
jgi:hypothetical protein